MKNRNARVLDFKDIDKTMLAIAGGKGANLGELSKLDGVQVPEGFCVTTEAYKEIIANNKAFDSLLDQLALLKANDRKNISILSAKIRELIENTAIPDSIVEEITRHLEQTGEKQAYVVRSSATAEDLPTASFAGQQDTYLNITGTTVLLRHISKCWASLYTDRAVTYRLQHGFDQRSLSISVVIQQLIFSDASGILFTADPVSGNRKVLSIDASFGLGEALVAGLVNADTYRVRKGEVIEKKIATKKLAIYTSANGGTDQQAIAPEQQKQQALSDEQILQLERLGRTIEAHFGSPQDIEWCLANGVFYIVQSRPITTLFPVPEANDSENHVYISVGHNQMMTDAIKPLGISFFKLNTNMYSAGGRLFVDVSRQLASPDSREKLIDTFGHSDLLIQDALITIAGRTDFIKPLAEADTPNRFFVDKVMPWSYLEPFENNHTLVPDLMAQSQALIGQLKQDIETQSGVALFDFILEHSQQSRQTMFVQKNMELVKIALYVTTWLNKNMLDWLGEKNAADTLSQSAPNNVTSQMGLALLDVADVIRPYPEVITYLQQIKDDDFLEGLTQFEGGPQSHAAIDTYLSRYGMRCAGEIDITKTRWSEKPSVLVPMILNHIKTMAPNASHQRFEQGKREALEKEQELLHRLRQLPDGEQKAEETKRMIGLLRNFIGYREYPKYNMISQYFVYKQALLKEAGQLVKARVIHEKEDVYYLSFEEFREAVRTGKLDNTLISERKAVHKLNEKLNPPRVITSDGEIVAGTYKRGNLPAGALVGLPVSSGSIEGRARVILNMEDANLEEGDILVTAFTDPSWTPLFVSIKGLVTEVGGLMTHGAVIAREYGLPAVVSLEHATQLIKDGQRIRVNGTDGYVEIL